MKNSVYSVIAAHKNSLMRLTVTAACMALAMVLPFLTGQIPEIGKMLAPMHLPIFLCGLMCGWQYGLVCGAVSPLLRCFLYGTPAFLSAFAMCFELAGYGFLAGLLYRYLPKHLPYLYLSLVGGMLFGRLTGVLCKLFLLGIGQLPEYSFAIFWSGYIAGCLPGIVLQIVLVPLLILALRRAGFRLNEGEGERIAEVHDTRVP